eukprot:8833930-Alexandrium_andersonii.AAC.1
MGGGGTTATCAHRLRWSRAECRFIGGQCCEWTVPLPVDARDVDQPLEARYDDLFMPIPMCALACVLLSMTTANTVPSVTQVREVTSLLP